MTKVGFYPRKNNELNIKLPDFSSIQKMIKGKWKLHVELEKGVVESIGRPLKEFVSEFVLNPSIKQLDNGDFLIEAVLEAGQIVRSLEMAEEIMGHMVTLSVFEYKHIGSENLKFVYYPHEYDFYFFGFDEEELFAKFKTIIGKSDPPKSKIIDIY